MSDGGAPLVLLHGLGMDRRIWAQVTQHLPRGLCVYAPDLRGHGAAPCPAGPYKTGSLVRDMEAALDGVRGAVVVGLGLGGLVAQALAVKRMEMVRALVLVNTAARIGFAPHWEARAEAVLAGGMTAVAEDELARWRPQDPEAMRVMRAMLLGTSRQGYAGGCAAMAHTDLMTPTSGLRLPTLGIAGAEGRAIPPDMLRETCALIPGARVDVIRQAGHVASMDQPEAFAALLCAFLEEIGHLTPQ